MVLASDLRQSLADFNRQGDDFITDYRRKKPRLEGIAEQFDDIVAAVERKKKDLEAVKKGSLWATGLGLGVAAVGVLGAPFTGGTSLALTAAGGAVAAGGAGLLLFTAVVEFLVESGKALESEQIGREFMAIARPLNDQVMRIKSMCQNLQLRAVEGVLQRKMQELEKALEQVRVQSEEASHQIDSVMAFLENLIRLLLRALREIATGEDNKVLVCEIVKTGRECRRIIREFDKMEQKLQGMRRISNPMMLT